MLLWRLREDIQLKVQPRAAYQHEPLDDSEVRLQDLLSEISSSTEPQLPREGS